MDPSPINLAHRCHRKAEYYLENYRFEDAIVCHLKAAAYLTEALKDTACEKIRASLKIQHDFHLSQENTLRKRSLSVAKRIESQRLQRQEMASQTTAVRTRNDRHEMITDVNKDERNALSTEIYRVMEEHDSLLQLLIQRKTDDSGKSEPNQKDAQIASSVCSNESLYKSGSKMAKDDKTKIEELQTVNEKLRQLVYQLLGELEKTQNENVRLKEENAKLKDENHNSYNTSLLDLPPLEQPTLLY